MSTLVAYWTAVAAGAVIAALLCVGCRRWPVVGALGRARDRSLILAVDALVFAGTPMIGGHWSVRGSLPLALCDVALVVAAIACWSPGWSLGIELTYYWALAGTLQAVLTPDLGAGFPQLEFFQFVVGHLGVVIAALYLVVGLQIVPRPRSVPTWFAITTTAAYAAFVGVVDWLTGSNYMSRPPPPRIPPCCSVLGPWPWYLLTATAVTLAHLILLDLPFHPRRRALTHRAPEHPDAAPAAPPRTPL